VLAASVIQSWLPRANWVPLALLAGLVVLVLPPLEIILISLDTGLPNVELPFSRGRGIYFDAVTVQNYQAVIGELDGVPRDEPIFVGTTRHHVFMMNDTLLYLLAERDPGTYYWCLDSGLTTSTAVQRQMIADLEARRVRHVLRVDSLAVEDFSPSPEAATLLDEHLRATFVPVKRFGPYELLRR